MGRSQNFMRKMIYAHKLAGSAYRLADRVTRPLNMITTSYKFLRGEGLNLPETKYIGPGNRMNKGKPVSKADSNAYQHDIDYDDYIKHGVSPKKVYTSYSDADKRLKERSSEHMHEDDDALAAWLGMSAKHLLHKFNFTEYIRDDDVYKDLPKKENEYQKQANNYQKRYNNK